jgi:hypothetical protein
MSKLPSKIKIGPYTYSLKYFPKKTTSNYGACVYAQQTIFLNRNQSAQRAADTLIHEILHAVWDLGALEVVVDLHEEVVVRVYGTWLSQVFKENPTLLQFILEPEKFWTPVFESDELKEGSK